MNITTSKEKPQGTHELLGHLGLSKDEEHIPKNIDEALAETADTAPVAHGETAVPAKHDAAADSAKPAESAIKKTSVGSGISIKKFIPYFLVFAVGVVAFVILFTNVSFSNLLKIKSQPAVQQASAQTIPASQQSAYNAWINSYFFDVSNPAILDPNYDYSGNGLTNYQKFLLGLNPTKEDTAGIGMTDAEALIAGINPLNGQSMSDSQKQVIAANIDLEGLSNRLALRTLDNTPQVLGASTVSSDTASASAAATAPANTSNSSDQTASAVAQQQQTTAVQADGSVPPINTSIKGELNIPDLKITVPLIFGNTPDEVDTDLQSGVVHYPGTALPGQIGTAYISGHSSNYVWAKGNYNQIFAKLGNLKKNASFTITATSTSGKKLTFHYVVTSSGTFSPTDQKQFASIGKSTVGLSTCWPVGTSKDRLVVFGQLVQVEQGQ